MPVELSIVIPTHNRAETLRNALQSLFRTEQRFGFEVVVVDNNSTDHTREVAEGFGGAVRRIFEPRTAFSCARDSGARAATGEILLYCDDDVLFADGTLESTVEVFRANHGCGVMAGRILPEYEVSPPKWALECQRAFNGWSLYNETTDSRLGNRPVEVESAAGPLMAVRKSVYEEIGGFPPDTLGVETNRSNRSFNKLYVGPGDWGLCRLAKRAGWKVWYEPTAVVRHCIPPARMTVGFWRSRLIGEAYHRLTCDWVFEPLTLGDYLRQLATTARNLRGRLEALREDLHSDRSVGLPPNEMWAWYYHSYLAMAAVYASTPRLPALLWRLGKTGVSDSEYDGVMAQLPARFLALTSSAYVYNDAPLSGMTDWARWSGRRVEGSKALRLLGDVAVPAGLAVAGRRPRGRRGRDS